MPRGGARPGSGPAPNPNSARSKARAARAAKVGLSLAPAPVSVVSVQGAMPAGQSGQRPETPSGPNPLDLMFQLMQCSDPRIALQAAIAAAPYVHPKLMPVKVKVDDKDRKPNRFAVPPTPPRLVSNKS